MPYVLRYLLISNVEAGCFLLSEPHNQGLPDGNELDMSTLSIVGGGSLELPVVPFSDLQEEVEGTICGIGFHAIDLDHSAPYSCGNSSTVKSSILQVIASYKTIFDEEKQLTSKLWVYHCEDCNSANKSFNLTVYPLLRSSNTAN